MKNLRQVQPVASFGTKNVAYFTLLFLMETEFTNERNRIEELKSH